LKSQNCWCTSLSVSQVVF